MKTRQINIRFPEDLLKDISKISSVLNINKSEWIKAALAEKVYEKKKEIYSDIKTMYKKGLISEKEIKKSLGEKILVNIKNEK
jgi:hypothetical protein